MNKKIKVLLAATYLVCLGLLLYAFFSFFDIRQINDYSYIRENAQILISFKNENFSIFILLFFIFGIIWVFLLGFGTPLAITSGFLFGNFIGCIICLLSLTLGSTLLFTFVNLYFKDLILRHLSSKIKKFKNLFQKSEFLYFFLFRFAGGGGIPFPIQNILPVIVEMKTKNYFYSTLFGLGPMIFVITSLGSGIEKFIENNQDPKLIDIIFDPSIYIPIISFLIVLILSYTVKKKFFKN